MSVAWGLLSTARIIDAARKSARADVVAVELEPASWSLR